MTAFSRPTLIHNSRIRSGLSARANNENLDGESDDPAVDETDAAVLGRRKALQKSIAVLTSTTSAAALFSRPPQAANAYDKAFPIELTATDPNSDVDSRARKVSAIRQQEARRASDAGLLAETPVLDSVLWGGALWLLLGSRSNPIATPLANLLYKVEQEEWLQDRNDGFFAKIPWEFLIILSFVFAGLGFGADALITALAEGDRTISLQLAGVSIIAGCSLELGRIASGEKKQTREESDRLTQLEQEFATFAEQRLKPGGNCHRNEVVAAFRRYYAKYRQSDSEEYPLNDLEIENLLRGYCRALGAKMSSAGFYNGIQINQDADVFVSKV